MKMENASPGRIILKLDKGYSKNTTAILATLNIRVAIYLYLCSILFTSISQNKTIGNEGITVDFRFIKVHTSN